MSSSVSTPLLIRPPRQSWWRRTSNARLILLYLLPALLVMGIITLYPLLFQVWLSFTDYGVKNLRVGSPPPNVVGFENYTNIFSSQLGIPNFEFLRLIIYNLFWALSNVVIHVVLGVAHRGPAATPRACGSRGSTGPPSSSRS